jgi:hypothetical protein
MFGNSKLGNLKRGQLTLLPLLAVSIAVGLSACSVLEDPMQAFQELPLIKPLRPVKPDMVSNNKIYYAPAQTYNLDLGATPFMGRLNMKESCAPQGHSLTIVDQTSKFYRIDVININNNPKYPNAQNSSTLELGNQITAMYKTLYGAFQEGQTMAVKSPIGPAGYSVLALPNLDQLALLIARQNDYVYVVQHSESKYSKQDMQRTLAEVAEAMQIPGKQLKKSKTELPISIDLANATPAQLADWKKLTRCS